MGSPLISVRVVNVDWYLSDESKLPVVRIFGSTPAGQRTCLHLHGALPYFMVQPMEDENSAICSQFENPESLNALLPQIEAAVESAMAASSGRAGGPSASPQRQGGSSGTSIGSSEHRWEQQRVLARLEVVRGIPFYGYHGQEKLFVKVYVCNPALTGKVASVMQAGHVLSTRFQPYESHVPFLLQVFIDYNISGMSYVHMKNALFLEPLPERSSIPDSQQSSNSDHALSSGLFTLATVPELLVARRPPADAFTESRDVDGAVEGTGLSSRTGLVDPKAVSGKEDEATRDLLAGISMSQLFSQPSTSPRPEGFRPYKEPSPLKPTYSPGKASSAAGKSQARTVTRWWERQTTIELEITGTVEDLMNPGLLASGRAEAEAGGKAMAVASLRELWEEEKERSRAAGGGSQLSAPPGLELAGSQNVWEPPEGLLTQELKDSVENLARNVLQRNPPQDSRSPERQTASQPLSQQTPVSQRSEDYASPQLDLTPSASGFPQGSAGVFEASQSPANYLPARSGKGNSSVDQGLLDMLEALRGSQSQGDGELEDAQSSPRIESKEAQSPPRSLSQQPLHTPTCAADRAEAIAETQKKQELEEEVLGKQMALAAQSEQNYDSDGSDDYHEPADKTRPIFDLAMSATRAVPVDARTPVTGPPPWSQRSATYPPWSQRGASLGADNSRSASFSFWSQRSDEAGSARFVRKAETVRQNSGEMGGQRHGEVGVGEKRVAEDPLSQLSSRSLDDLEDSVRAKITQAGSLKNDDGEGSKSSPPDVCLAIPATKFESSELVGIISSQIEVEHDQGQGDDEPHDDEEVDGRLDELVQRDFDHNDDEWTRGPIQLRYDENDEASTDGHGVGEDETLSGLAPPLADDQQVETSVPNTEKATGKSPLRLRGGVGLSRTKTGPLDSLQSARVHETRDKEDDSATPADQGAIRLPNQSAGIRRSGSLGALDKRRVLGAPGALRRVASMPSGRFKPPRPTVAALNALPIGDSGGCKASDGVATSRACGDGCSEKKRNLNGADSSCGCGFSRSGSDTESDKPSTQDRSQVVVPGWGSQGHHPVEYRESQLNFVTTAELRASPTLARGSESSKESGDNNFTRKRRKISEARNVGRGAGKGEETGERSPSAASNTAVDVANEVACGEKERLGIKNDSREKDPEVYQIDGGEEAREAYPAVDTVTGENSSAKVLGQRGRGGDGMVETTTDVERRWRGADERLRLAQRRVVSTPSLLRGRGDDCNDGAKEEAVALAPEISRVLPSGALNARGRGESSVDQDGSDAIARPADTLGEVLSQGIRKRNCAETRLEGGGNSSQGVETTPRGVTRNSLPDSTPSSALARGDNLSPCSDHSCIPPLGQRTPAVRMKRARYDTPASLHESQQQWDECDLMEDERSSHSPRVSLASEGAPRDDSSDQQRLSGFTPSIPRSCEYNSGVVILRPREKAPDPAMCAEALMELGIPQVVYTEPYFSRKDDVPERPREFAGKVFRIPHKDDLQDFDTLPSREVFHARSRVEADSTAAFVAMPSFRRHGDEETSSALVQTQQQSQPLSPSPWSQPSSTDAGSSCGPSTSSPRRQRVAGKTASSAGKRIDIRGVASAPLSWDAGNRSKDASGVLRSLKEWKEDIAAAASSSRGILISPRRRRRVRKASMVELVPATSPPSYKAVEAWSVANPGSSCRRKVVDDLGGSSLRSAKNALGIFAGGGDTDLAEDRSAEMSLVEDVNTGQLVPAAVSKDRTDAPQPAEHGLFEAEVASTKKSSGVTSTGEVSNMPPRGTPCSVPSCVDDQNPSSSDFPVNAPGDSTPAKRPTQGPHRPSNKSQISPTTQTPCSDPSGEENAASFAFGGVGTRARPTAAAAPAGGSQGSEGPSLGLNGSVLGRNDGGNSGAMGDRLTILSLEIHVQVVANRRPDPRRDPVHAVCWKVKDAFTSSDREVVETTSGVIVLPLALATRGTGGGYAAGPTGDAICVKCGEPRDDDARAFCTFEGGGFLGQEGFREGPGRGTFCHGLGEGVEVLEVCSEAQVFVALVSVFSRHDPDFVVGWEVQGDSLGYLVERGFSMEPSMDMTRLLSRTPGRDADRRNTNDEWGKTHGSGIWITGRTVLNIWRLMRSELKLCSYTLQSVAEHVLRKRVPSFSLQLRSKWFAGRNVVARSRALAEPLSRATICLTILEKLDLLGRTSEMARLFGIDFFSVLSRGSQYRVEAVMLRVLKPQNYVAVTPSRNQVASQAAMESLPLVFEPRSRLYTSPVVVVDFQSLYPSMIIAYNLCYSTILGKFDPKTGGTSGSLGVLPYSEAKTSEALAQAEQAQVSWEQKESSQDNPRAACSTGDPRVSRPGLEGIQIFSQSSRLNSTEDGRDSFSAVGDGREGNMRWDPRCIHVAANAAGFCHPSLRQGILPLMLREILETRVMVKGAMRRAEAAGHKVLARTLNARQYALKMISNVTYGYTAAGFSGRMPMAELADAIVESGRQTLIAAARTVENHETWQASVVYGDTDSLFIELPGRSVEEAHRIGREIAAVVSKSCPPDVILKFEKVYLPCILASKKRYVGHMYESPKDLKPTFDAKGIETVRRDGCPLLVKILERVIRMLFNTKDLSQVKGYLYRQWTRILTDRAAVGDFIFSKEVRLGTYASDVYMPPSAIVASKAMASDPRAEPKYCERVPYVVVAGPVGARLMDLVVSPEQFLAEGSGLRLNGKYYITKVINPALDRALSLVGVDVNAWYSDMPRPAPRVMPKAGTGGGGRGDASVGGAAGWDGAGAGRKGKGKGSGARRSCVITNFFISDRCSLCGEQCAKSVCGKCARESSAKCVAMSRLRESDMTSLQLMEICRQCSGHAPSELFGTDSCESIECPVFFERHRAMLKGQEARDLCDALRMLST